MQDVKTKAATGVPGLDDILVGGLSRGNLVLLEGSPGTGLPPDWERTLSSPFVIHPTYGTRCSTVLLIEPSGATVMAERRFAANGEPSGDTEIRLNAGQWP